MLIGKSLRFIVIVLLACAAPVKPVAALGSGPYPARITHHDVAVSLRPDTHELIARDEQELLVYDQAREFSFSLAPTLHIESIMIVHRAPGDVGGTEQPVTFKSDRAMDASTQRIVVTLPTMHERNVTLRWTYRGMINDPPKEPRHLRFVTPSETAGHIGPEGVYLSSESQWYPDIEGSLSTFAVTVQVPAGWTVVTQGKKMDEKTADGMNRTTWVVSDPSEALTLVVNQFVTKTRAWKGANGRHVELATYFFPDNAGLAEEYLEATAKYLDAYVPILGDYPFEKFAVVENFFASGLGMPSFTLLGSGSIKRHYTQPYALGHEIVHSWIGNSVFNRADHGNWVEGLTTYVANYYWHELTHDERQAREQRRMMIDSYSLYVKAEEDYPVAQFTRKRDEKDNAIGYQKAAFVFHLLRHEIGEDAFWRGLHAFVAAYRHRPADWGSLEQAFARAGGRDLRWFFAQWVERAGAPIVWLDDATAEPAANGDQRTWKLAVRLQQGPKLFRLVVPLEIATVEGTETRWVSLSRSEETVELTLPTQPLRVRLDPDFQLFRRIEREHLPPMLNGFVTDEKRSVVRAFSDPASPLNHVLTRLADQEAQLPEDQRTIRLSLEEPIPPTGSLLVLAGAEQHKAVQALIDGSCGHRVRLDEGGIHIDGQAYGGPATAVLLSCPRTKAPGSVITVLYGVTPQAVAKVSRLLFYYGWHSVVIFRDGAVVARDVWEGRPDMKEVRVDANR